MFPLSFCSFAGSGKGWRGGGGSGRDRSVVKFHLIHRLAYRTHYFSGINDHRPILCFALMASVYFDPTHLYRLFLSFYPRGLFPSQLLPSDHARPRTRIATEALRVTKISCACPLNWFHGNNVSLLYFKQRFSAHHYLGIYILMLKLFNDTYITGLTYWYPKIDAFWMVLRFRCILHGFVFYIYMNLNICHFESRVINFKPIFLIAIKEIGFLWFLGILLFNVCRSSKHARTFGNKFAKWRHSYFSLHWCIKFSCERLMYVTKAHVAQFKYANFKSMTIFFVFFTTEMK